MHVNNVLFDQAAQLEAVAAIQLQEKGAMPYRDVQEWLAKFNLHTTPHSRLIHLNDRVADYANSETEAAELDALCAIVYTAMIIAHDSGFDVEAGFKKFHADNMATTPGVLAVRTDDYTSDAKYVILETAKKLYEVEIGPSETGGFRSIVDLPFRTHLIYASTRQEVIDLTQTFLEQMEVGNA